MKLLWVFSTFAIGGPQRRAALLMERFGGEHEHIGVALDNQWQAQQFIGGGVRWRRLPLAFGKSRFVSLSNLSLIYRTLKELAPDLLLTSNWGTIEWAIANCGRGRVRHIHFEDGFGPDESASRQSPRRVLARRLLLRNRPVVVPSETLRELAISCWRLPAAGVHFIPNAIDVARYAQPVKSGGPLVIGSLGALRAEKNYPRLVRAVAGAGGDLTLRIHGEGDQRDAILQAARSTGLKGVELPGATNAPEAALASFDIFALSSDTEQMPISLMEAMATGLPVAATDVGDIAQMVSAENRPFVTPAGDEAALAASIKTLAGDPALRARLGAANQAKARAEFAAERMVAAYAALFRQVAAAR